MDLMTRRRMMKEQENTSELLPTVVKSKLSTINSSGFLELTTNAAAFCGFQFDESVSGGILSIQWDTDDWDILDFQITMESENAYSAIFGHNVWNSNYGIEIDNTGFTSSFYGIQYGKYYEDKGTFPSYNYPYSGTGNIRIKIPSGYKIFSVSARRRSTSISVNGLPTGNDNLKNWMANNLIIKLIGGTQTT